MNHEQLCKIEQQLQNAKSNSVEIFVKGSGSYSITGEYHRDENSDLIRLTRGISTHYIDIESVSAIGVRHNERIHRYTEEHSKAGDEHSQQASEI